METRIKEILDVSKKVLDHTKIQNSKEITQALQEAIDDLENNPDAVVQLYSVSQAGKSTLFSLLTQGEQYVPIGLGKATTAVAIELISASSNEEEQAEVRWLSPVDLLALVIEPLEPFLPNKKVSIGKDSQKDYIDNLTGNVRDIFHKTESQGEGLKSIDADENSDHEENEESDEESVDPSTLKSSDLANPKIRRVFFRALRYAKEFRKTERASSSNSGDVDGGNDLAVAEVILNYYQHYIGEYRGGYQNVPLAEIYKWTRQPSEWGTKPLVEFGFDDLRCFFIQKVRLHAHTHPIAEGIRIVDSPGFGVSRLHDRLSRRVQETADAVILLLGAAAKQIDEAQLTEVQQLAMGLRDNLFVIWNPKSGTKHQASGLLKDDLVDLRHRAGISVPEERAKVANLRLALRSMQWQKFDSLTPITVRSLSDAVESVHSTSPPSEREKAKRLIKRELSASLIEFVDTLEEEGMTADEKARAGVEYSGWDALPDLFDLIRSSRENQRAIRIRECIGRAIDSILFYLAQFPPPSKIEDIEKNINALLWLKRNFDANVDETAEEFEQSLCEKSERILEELVQYITKEKFVVNLHAVVQQSVNSEIYSSVLHTKLRAKVKDYFGVRCRVWCDAVCSFKSRESRSEIQMEFEMAVAKSQKWLQTMGKEQGLTIALDIPDASLPQINFDKFRKEFEKSFGIVVDQLLTPRYVQKFSTWISELGHDVQDDVINFLEGGKGLWGKLLGQTVTETSPKNKQHTSTARKSRQVRFDRNALKQQLKNDLEKILESYSIKRVLVDNPDLLSGSSLKDYLVALTKSVIKNRSERNTNLEFKDIADVVKRANEIIEQEREDKISAPNGPIVFALKAIADATEKTFIAWRNAVKDTIIELIDNLEKQTESNPSPLPQEELGKIEGFVNSLSEFSDGKHDMTVRLVQAKKAIEDHQGSNDSQLAIRQI